MALHLIHPKQFRQHHTRCYETQPVCHLVIKCHLFRHPYYAFRMRVSGIQRPTMSGVLFVLSQIHPFASETDFPPTEYCSPSELCVFLKAFMKFHHPSICIQCEASTRTGQTHHNTILFMPSSFFHSLE